MGAPARPPAGRAQVKKPAAQVRLASAVRRHRRHTLLRRSIRGTAEKPRLSVFRSSAHIYGQLIDDTTGRTLAAASTVEKDIAKGAAKSKTDRAEAVGRALGERAREAGITRVVFDRGGYLYHGRVTALARGARAAGLEF